MFQNVVEAHICIHDWVCLRLFLVLVHLYECICFFNQIYMLCDISKKIFKFGEYMKISSKLWAILIGLYQNTVTNEAVSILKLIYCWPACSSEMVYGPVRDWMIRVRMAHYVLSKNIRCLALPCQCQDHGCSCHSSLRSRAMSSFDFGYAGYIDGNLPKGPYPPCLRMTDRALSAGYPRYLLLFSTIIFYFCHLSIDTKM